MAKRQLIFIGLVLLGVGMIYSPLFELLNTATRREYYSHILLIPLVSGCLIYWNRSNLLAEVSYSYRGGISLLGLGVLLYLIGNGHKNELNQNDYSALLIFSVIIFWMGAFLFTYGLIAFRRALFPLLFLLFTVPIPSFILDKIIYFLQSGSAEVTYWTFQLADLPVSRNGFTFQLPKVNIEVAKECSGIRSSIALFITSLLLGHLFLKPIWKKIILIFSIIPITIFKNGVRIVTLSLLGNYVDERFLTGGFLHKSGGFIFYLPALGILGAILLILRRN